MTKYGNDYYNEVQGMKPIKYGNYKVTINPSDNVLTIEEDGSILANLTFAVEGKSLILNGKEGKKVTSIELPFAMTEVSKLEYKKDTQEIILTVKDADNNKIPFSIDVSDLATIYKAGDGLQETEVEKNTKEFKIKLKDDEKHLKLDSNGLSLDLGNVANEDTINAIKEEIKTNSDNITKANKAIETLGTELKEADAEINEKVTKNIADIEKLGKTDEEIKTSIEQEKKDRSDSDVELGSKIDKNADDIKTLGDRITPIEELSNTNKEEIDGLKKEVEGLNTKVDTNKNESDKAFENVNKTLEETNTKSDKLREDFNNLSSGTEEKLKAMKESVDAVDGKIDTKQKEFAKTVELRTVKIDEDNKTLAKRYALFIGEEKRGVTIDIEKDKVLKEVKYDTDSKSLVFTWANGDKSEVSVTDLSDVYQANKGLDLTVGNSGKLFGIKTEKSKFLEINSEDNLDVVLDIEKDTTKEKSFAFVVKRKDNKLVAHISFEDDINKVVSELESKNTEVKKSIENTKKEIIGTDEDDSSKLTLNGIKKFATEEAEKKSNAALEAAKSYSDEKLNDYKEENKKSVDELEKKIDTKIQEEKKDRTEKDSALDEKDKELNASILANSNLINQLSTCLGVKDKEGGFIYPSGKAEGIVDKLFTSYHQLVNGLNENELNEFIVKLVNRVKELENKIAIVQGDKDTTNSIKSSIESLRNELKADYTNKLSEYDKTLKADLEKIYQPKGNYVIGDALNFVNQQQLDNRETKILNEVEKRNYADKAFVADRITKSENAAKEAYVAKGTYEEFAKSVLTTDKAESTYSTIESTNKLQVNLKQKDEELLAKISRLDGQLNGTDSISDNIKQAQESIKSANNNVELLTKKVDGLDNSLSNNYWTSVKINEEIAKLNKIYTTQEVFNATLSNYVTTEDLTNKHLVKYLTIEAANEKYEPKNKV